MSNNWELKDILNIVYGPNYAISMAVTGTFVVTTVGSIFRLFPLMRLLKAYSSCNPLYLFYKQTPRP